MAVVSVVSLDGSTYNKDNSFMRGVFYTMLCSCDDCVRLAVLGLEKHLG